MVKRALVPLCTRHQSLLSIVKSQPKTFWLLINIVWVALCVRLVCSPSWFSSPPSVGGGAGMLVGVIVSL
jgi:hypothetical protein